MNWMKRGKAGLFCTNARSSGNFIRKRPVLMKKASLSTHPIKLTFSCPRFRRCAVLWPYLGLFLCGGGGIYFCSRINRKAVKRGQKWPLYDAKEFFRKKVNIWYLSAGFQKNPEIFFGDRGGGSTQELSWDMNHFVFSNPFGNRE